MTTFPTDAVQARLLSELVAGLTATRNETALCRTIDCWKARVRACGLDPDALIDLVRRECAPDRHNVLRDNTWIRADKREFALVCIEVYMRHVAASPCRAAGARSDEQHGDLAVSHHVLGDAPEYQPS